MSKRLKIAVYSGEIPSTTFIERLINGISKNNCVVFLFGFQKKKTSYFNSNIVVKSFSDSRLNKLFLLVKYSFLLFLLKNTEKKRLDEFICGKSKNKTLLYRIKYYPVLWYKPDIFHLQWAKSVGDWYWVQQFGIKLVVSLRGAHINYSPVSDWKLAETYKRIFPTVDAFHAVSKAIGEEAQKYHASPEKIKVVYSGLVPIPHISSFKPKSNLCNEIFEIVSIGRSHWKKGYSYALDAVKILFDQGINVKYIIIGVKDSEELEFQRADLKLENNVEFIEHIPFSSVQRMMAHADLVLLPSVEEGIANVVLEAMQIGTLVLSTNCGGMNEVIQHGKNGFLVPVRDSDKMAQIIAKIVALSESDKNELLLQAKKTIEKKHTDSKMILDMISLYTATLKQ